MIYLHFNKQPEKRHQEFPFWGAPCAGPHDHSSAGLYAAEDFPNMVWPGSLIGYRHRCYTAAISEGRLCCRLCCPWEKSCILKKSYPRPQGDKSITAHLLVVSLESLNCMPRDNHRICHVTWIYHGRHAFFAHRKHGSPWLALDPCLVWKTPGPGQVPEASFGGYGTLKTLNASRTGCAIHCECE